MLKRVSAIPVGSLSVCSTVFLLSGIFTRLTQLYLAHIVLQSHARVPTCTY